MLIIKYNIRFKATISKVPLVLGRCWFVVFRSIGGSSLRGDFRHAVMDNERVEKE